MLNSIIIIDEDRKIKIDKSILSQITEYRQIKKDIPESGGVLIGRENVSNENLIIDRITCPMKNDYQSRIRFIRKDLGHMKMFNQLYNESEGTVGYMGEWHTHPEDIPHYSFIDIENWNKIYKQSGKKEQIHLIAGRKAVAIWKYAVKSPKIELVIRLFWQDLEGEETKIFNKGKDI